MIPGEILPGTEPVVINAGRPELALTVRNTGDRPVQVGSHYHFAEANPALEFDRKAAWGHRLGVPAGTSVRFEPGVAREELARRRISRQHLADQAKISISTLEKALAGRRPFTLTTTIRLEEALGVSLRRSGHETLVPAIQNGVARGDLGSYARPAVSWIEGSYLTLRPSFGDREAIYAYKTEISWDDRRSILVFRESDRIDAEFTHSGEVSVPNQSGHIYLVTNTHGQYRLIIVARPQSPNQ